MMRPENFISFLTVCGFFIGLIFVTITPMDPMMMVWGTIGISLLFYIIALAGSSYFIKYVDLKSGYDLNRDYYEVQLDKAVKQIERREAYLRDSERFIRNLEKEILENREGEPL